MKIVLISVVLLFPHCIIGSNILPVEMGWGCARTPKPKLLALPKYWHGRYYAVKNMQDVGIEPAYFDLTLDSYVEVTNTSEPGLVFSITHVEAHRFNGKGYAKIFFANGHAILIKHYKKFGSRHPDPEFFTLSYGSKIKGSWSWSKSDVFYANLKYLHH